MELSAKPAAVDEILTLREAYRREMNCQIIHDSLHSRAGWTQPFLLFTVDEAIGYGSLAVCGPWTGKPTIFEFYVLPEHRSRAFDLFHALLTTSRPLAIEVQSNDVLLTVMLHAFAKNVTSEKILFQDQQATTLSLPGAIFRAAAPEDAEPLRDYELDPSAGWVVTIDGIVAAAGGILFHYNKPYGDIFMKVAEPFRGRGLGTFLVQELKRVCYEAGNIPAARCNTTNVASRRTLQKAGFVPCGHILVGTLDDRAL